MEEPIEPAHTTWVALKFGGTSVAKAEGWRSIQAAARRVREEGHRALLVCSALSGVSDRLEDLITKAAEGHVDEESLAALREQHRELAADLGVPLPHEIDASLGIIRDGLHGARLVREATPRLRAWLMAQGELMSTRLGAAWLESEGLDAAWLDARTFMHATIEPGTPDGQHYLSARVEPHRDPEAVGRPHDVVVTQGFIARDDEGDTVLLGRGGSDTSAACLGVIFGAERVEIWTDVSGMYSANPNAVPNTQHLERLDYDEAGVMASMGACVLHPRCIEPARENRLPVLVKSTYDPQGTGTTIQPMAGEPGIRAVTSRDGLVLLSLARPSQWQPVGFVADVSAVFKQHGLSIDLMSTSPSTITVTVDPTASPQTSLDQLVASLSEVADVSVTEPVASVSLVGRGVRDVFGDLGGAMRTVETATIHMVVQGAANHHLTFIVNESEADDLVAQLHGAIHPEVPDLSPVRSAREQGVVA